MCLLGYSIDITQASHSSIDPVHFGYDKMVSQKGIQTAQCSFENVFHLFVYPQKRSKNTFRKADWTQIMKNEYYFGIWIKIRREFERIYSPHVVVTSYFAYALPLVYLLCCQIGEVFFCANFICLISMFFTVFEFLQKLCNASLGVCHSTLVFLFRKSKKFKSEIKHWLSSSACPCRACRPFVRGVGLL